MKITKEYLSKLVREAVKEEKSKPSAGLTKKERSNVAKRAHAGKDVGKPGENFDKVAAAAKKSGAKDPKAVAAAQMWKQEASKKGKK